MRPQNSILRCLDKRHTTDDRSDSTPVMYRKPMFTDDDNPPLDRGNFFFVVKLKGIKPESMLNSVAKEFQFIPVMLCILQQGII